jgi:tripartite-type tricarboxylate transporter receptor subunit TctC
MRRTVLKLPLCAWAFVALISPQGSVQAQDDSQQFFKDRQLTFYVGAAAGGPSDIVGRVIAANIGGHIAGRPQIMVQNMPGAGSLIMMNHIYNRAPRDGSAMGLPLNGVLIEQRLKLSEGSGGAVRFDLNKMSWIGSVSEQTQVLWSWRTSPFQTFEDVRWPAPMR